MRVRGGLVTLWIAVAVTGCRMSDRYDVPPPLMGVDRAAHLRDREAEAREILLARLGSLSAEDRALIQDKPSRVGQYVMARAYGQYFFNWQLTDGRTAYMMRTGDVTTPLDAEHVSVGIRGARRYG